jgi:hypothetical protein
MTVALKIVKQDTVYETIQSFITDSSKSIGNYEDMIEVVLEMIKVGHCFLMDRDILRDALETLTFMYEPNDDMNRDRVILQLIDVDEEDDIEDEDVSMDMLKNFGKMMGMPDMTDEELTDAPAEEEPTDVKTDVKTDEPAEEEPTDVKTVAPAEEAPVAPTEEEPVDVKTDEPVLDVKTEEPVAPAEDDKVKSA